MSKPNVVATVIGAGIATAGFIRRARLNNAMQQLREDEKTYKDARKALDLYMAGFPVASGPNVPFPAAFNAFYASQLQMACTDALTDVQSSQRKVDQIQNEEPIMEMAAGAGLAELSLSGVGGGDDVSGGDASWILPALTGLGGYVLGENSASGDRRRDNPSA